MKIVYLDNAATTQMLPEVIDVVTESMQNLYANASSTYSIGRKSKAEIELARKKIAEYIGVSASEIVFTSGGTEANNLILQSVIKNNGVQHIITSKIEHHAVLKTIETLKEAYKLTVDYVEFTENGEISLESVKQLLEQEKGVCLVSLMHINNEIGSILDLKEMGDLCKKHNAFFHTDTVQTIGHYPLDFNEIHVDFATASAHKFHGPKGIGFAYIKQNSKIKAIQFGGEQERGMRAGTEAVSLILGMKKALELSYENLNVDKKRISGVKTYAIERISEIPEISFNADSDKNNRNYNLLNICLPISSEKASTVLFQLDLAGICCSRGSACQSGSNKPSHVLKEILPKDKLEYTSLRFSFSKFTTKKEIEYLVQELKKLLS